MRRKPTCKAHLCEEPSTGRGYCNRHYQLWRRHGEPRPPSYLDRAKRRLMNKVVPNDSGCWIWQGTTSHYGHGRMIFHGRREAAHRVSYVLHKGAIPDGAYICHTCDVPSCVNPDHLYAGDAVSNARDMVLRERQARGDRNPRAKLTAADVQSIRSSKSPGTHLARQYGVSSTLIYQIRKRAAWRHV